MRLFKISDDLLKRCVAEARDPHNEEPLDGDAVEDFCKSLMRAMDLHEGNVDWKEDERVMNPFKEEAGVISPEEIWVYHSVGYMYNAPTFTELLSVIANEWKHDKHLVG